MEGQTEHADKWRWECEDCRIEYLVEDYRFCSRCGEPRPPWIGTGKTCKEWLGRVDYQEGGWMNGDADWVHPSQRSPEGKAAFEKAVEEVRQVGEWRHEQEFAEEARLRTANRRGRHYGVWHPQLGWTWAYGIVFHTESRAIAEAQCDVSRRMGLKDSDLWEVRCIEEWADEQQAGG